jgi:cytochrome b subunit of formate dehydrogenase
VRATETGRPGIQPATARRGLHGLHTLTSLALVATGLLIQWPELRAWLVGGYGRELALLHEQSALVFLAAPVLALALAGRALLRDATVRLSRPRLTWRKVHLATSLVLSLALSVSGAVMWLDRGPLGLLDASVELHVWSTWAFLATLAVHLVAARGKIREALAVCFGLRAPTPLD